MEGDRGTHEGGRESMSDTLKSCPFCGGKAEMNTGSFGEKFVTCSDNNCGGRLGTGIWSASETVAIALWNNRPDSQLERELATANARLSANEVILSQAKEDNEKLQAKVKELEGQIEKMKNVANCADGIAGYGCGKFHNWSCRECKDWQPK